METRRKRFLGVHVDPDVREWVEKRSAEERLNLSAFVNRIFAATMEAEGGQRKRRSRVEVG